MAQLYIDDYLSQRDLGDEQEPSEYGKCGYCSLVNGVPPDPDCPKHGVSQWLDRMQEE